MAKPQFSQQFFTNCAVSSLNYIQLDPFPKIYIYCWRTGQHKQQFFTTKYHMPCSPMGNKNFTVSRMYLNYHIYILQYQTEIQIWLHVVGLVVIVCLYQLNIEKTQIWLSNSNMENNNFCYPFQYTYLTLEIHNCEWNKWCSKLDIYLIFASTNYPVATIYSSGALR